MQFRRPQAGFLVLHEVVLASSQLSKIKICALLVLAASDFDRCG